jgi:hypothetical protein
MKRILLVSTLFFCFSISFSQTILNFTIIPSNPTSTNNVRVVTHVVFGSNANLVSSSTVQIGNVINMKRCYALGPAAIADQKKDTLDLGFMTPGSYTVNYLGAINSNTNCTPTFTSAITFTVLSTPSNITRHSQYTKVKLYPNPFKDKLIVSTTNSDAMDIKVFDCLGKLVAGKQKYNSGETLDLSELNKGLYILQLSQNGIIKDHLRIIKD